jgi:hypothetical protein
VSQLALEYSRQIAPESPIQRVAERDLEGCMGALVCSDEKPRQWGIAYHKGQSPGRRAFTLGHELGHYVLHRNMVDNSSGFYCDEESVLRRLGEGIEKEADTFAAAVLMPLHDFRRQLPAKDRPDFERLSALAKRYGVSLTAAILRWLEYTETRAIMVVSNEGFALWSWSSDPALKSGRFIRTRQNVFELPSRAIAVMRDFSKEAKAGIEQPVGGLGVFRNGLSKCVFDPIGMIRKLRCFISTARHRFSMTRRLWNSMYMIAFSVTVSNPHCPNEYLVKDQRALYSSLTRSANV